MTLKQIFEKYQDEFIKFENIKDKFSNRPDLHAFILLDQLLPGNDDIIVRAGHKELYLSIDVKDLEKVINEEQVCDLLRCGVTYDSYYDALHMFT